MEIKWRTSIMMIAVSALVIVGAFWTTFTTMYATWANSQTFTHCFFVAPLSAWLVWRERRVLKPLRPTSTYLFLQLLVVVGLAWLFATYIDILLFKQLAVVTLFLVIVLSVLGWQVTKKIVFPLLLLYFLVPAGDELIPYLIDFTANFTVAAVRMVGVPVYQEGQLLFLPTGTWSVVKQCSGVRYLIASFMLGFLYAYLNYTKLWKRLLFIAISLIVPVIANGMRASMIVLLGHYSDMTLAVGVDHLIYGWVFFGIVIGAMFYLGSFFADPVPNESPLSFALDSNTNRGGSSRKAVTVLLLALTLSVVWPLYYHYSSEQPQLNGKDYSVGMPDVPGWAGGEPIVTDWIPAYRNFDADGAGNYRTEQGVVKLYIAYYNSQHQDHELVNYHNSMLDEHDTAWHVVEHGVVTLTLAGKEVDVSRMVVKSESERLSLLYFNYMESGFVAGDTRTKLAEATLRLRGLPTYGALVTVISPYSQEAVALNSAFAEAAADAVAGKIRAAHGE